MTYNARDDIYELKNSTEGVCKVCMHYKKEPPEECIAADCECSECKAACVCRDCIDENKFVWRGDAAQKENIMNNNTYYIIRADRAGVFFGHIKSREGSEVTMTDVRRLWHWDGACSLSQLAVDGTKEPGECKFTVTVPEMTILGVIEIIPCLDKAVESILAVKEWKR